MYRFCPECNDGEGVRLQKGQVVCPEEHEGVVLILEAGDSVGDFKVEQALPAGEGGYATVYRATPRPPGQGSGQEDEYPKVVALKVAGTTGRAALEHEASALSTLWADQGNGLAHLPRIYPVAPQFRAPVASGGPGATSEYVGRLVLDLEPLYYIAIEYLPGGTLRGRIDKAHGNGLGVPEVMRIGRQVADTLDSMHHSGMIHLDIKPSNIMFNASGEPVLIDFGIAAREEGEENSWPGTAPYAPREQINQHYPDHRADIHALGVTIFEMLTGRLPYTGASATALATAVRVARPLPLARLSPRLAYLDPALRVALDPDPDQRYNSAGEMMSALEAAVAGKGGPGRGPIGARAAVAIAACLVLLAVALGSMGALAGTNTGTATSPAATSASAPTQARTTTRSSAARKGTATPTPGRIAITQPDEGAAFVGAGSHILLAWNDPAGQLATGEYYVVELVRPDAKRVQYRVKVAGFEVPAPVYAETNGRFSWRVYRYRPNKNGKPVAIAASTSRINSFWWISPTPTPSATRTATTTLTATETSVPTHTPAPRPPTRTNTPILRLAPTSTPRR